ncbi:MAG: hypothetical protein KF773_03555 [Deltaproteobacteria bacterium]|nr:hypothetical protein [Deltaproteobacteria bacterium]MCW5801649.1 hypothetical protein [Deltaproteobacteria bacterium]
MTNALAKRGSHAPGGGRRVLGPAFTLGGGMMFAAAIGSTFLVALALVVAGVHGLAAMPAMDARRYRWKQARLRRKRRVARTRKLEAAIEYQVELTELDTIVEAILARDPHDPLEIESLLDRYVELALARHACLAVLARADPQLLEARLGAAKQYDLQTGAILEHRVAHARSVAAAAWRYAEAIDEVSELIRYCGERALTPDSNGLRDSDVVVSVLARCEAVDALDETEAGARSQSGHLAGVVLGSG